MRIHIFMVAVIAVYSAVAGYWLGALVYMR
jgi:hypothetical protein